MHLLANSQEGSLNSDEVIDLEQKPADIIFISAADSELKALADGFDRLITAETAALSPNKSCQRSALHR